MQLAGERNVSGKTPVAGDQRLVFKARHRAADKSHGVQCGMLFLDKIRENLPLVGVCRNDVDEKG
jgi:hypothetical protein